MGRQVEDVLLVGSRVSIVCVLEACSAVVVDGG
jgi:hypothetical protein